MERRPWATPCLTSHPSLTVLTRSVLGVDPMFLLQTDSIGASGGGIGGGGPNGNRVGQPTSLGSSGPPRH